MWTRSRFNNEYVDGMFALMIDTYQSKRAESMWSELCTIKTSKKSKEQNGERSGLGMPSLKGESAPVAFDVQIGGALQTWVPDVWALAVRISEEAIFTNLYELNGGGDGNLKELSDDLAAAMAENYEMRHARFLNSATSTTYHTTRHSKALLATDHPRLDGTTFSNLATNADMTYLAFWACLIAAENQYNHRQYKVTKRVKNLWIPPQLERQAVECLQSPDRPDTGNRAINAYSKSGRGIKIKPWPHITDVDAWIMQLEGEGIIHFDLRKTRFAREADFQTCDMMIKADHWWSAEINDPRCFYGNVPA